MYFIPMLPAGLILVWICSSTGKIKEELLYGGSFCRVTLWVATLVAGFGFSFMLLSSFFCGATGLCLSPAELAGVLELVVVAECPLAIVALFLCYRGPGEYEQQESKEVKGHRKYFDQVFSNPGKTVAKAVTEEEGLVKKVIVFAVGLVLVTLFIGFFLSFGLVRYFANSASAQAAENC